MDSIFLFFVSPFHHFVVIVTIKIPNDVATDGILTDRRENFEKFLSFDRISVVVQRQFEKSERKTNKINASKRKKPRRNFYDFKRQISFAAANARRNV